MSAVLPPDAAAMSKATNRDGGRYSIERIRVMIFQEGWRLEATDGKMLAVLRGPHAEVPREMQPLPEAPDGSAWDKYDFQVGPDVWKLAFGHLGGKKPVILAATPEGHIAVAGVNGAKVAEKTDGGIWPAINDIIPKREPLIVFALSCDLVRRAMELAAAILGGDNTTQVNFLYYGQGEPIGASARTSNGLTLDMMLMPLVMTYTKADAITGKELPGDDDEEEPEEDGGEDGEENEEEDAEFHVPPDPLVNGVGH